MHIYLLFPRHDHLLTDLLPLPRIARFLYRFLAEACCESRSCARVFNEIADIDSPDPQHLYVGNLR